MPLYNSHALLHLLVQMPAHLMVPSLTVINEMDLCLGSERRQKSFGYLSNLTLAVEKN